MLGVYFSGTGNSRYALEVFLHHYEKEAKVFSIEDDVVIDVIRENDLIIFSYPNQYSSVPKILRDFIINNKELWANKENHRKKG